MLFADGDALPPQVPPWVAVILALGGVSGLAGGVTVLVAAFIKVRRYYFGEKQQTVRQAAAQQRTERRERIEDIDAATARWQELHTNCVKDRVEADRLHREEVDEMDRAHNAETAELRREINEVKDEHADCRVRVARLEEALRNRGWDIPDDPSRPATPPEHRDVKTDPRQ